MLIRIKNKKSGVIDYLINGKVSQGIHRDEYDTRTIVSGDMHQTAAEIQWALANTEWKTTYKHFTAGFSAEEGRRILSLPAAEQKAALEAITLDIIGYHFPHRDPSELIHHCEAHIPKFPHHKDEDGKERLPHIHIVVPLRDPKTDSKLVCIPKNDAYMAAIQSEICAKYADLLTDPVVSMLKNQDQGIERKKLSTNFSEGKQGLIEYLAEVNPASGAELHRALLAFDGLDQSYSPRLGGSEKAGSRFIEVKLKGVKRSVNIRGNKFPAIEKLFNEYRATSDDTALKKSEFARFKRDFFTDETKVNTGIFGKLKASYKDQKLRDSLNKVSLSREDIYKNEQLRKSIIEENRQKFLAKGHNKPLSKKTLEKREAIYQKSLADIDEKLENLSKAQRSFYVLYGSNVSKKYVTDGAFFRPRENPSVIVYTSKTLKCKVIDHGDKLTASTSKDTDINKVAKLMIEQGLAKGWKLETLQITGSKEWKQAVKEEIAARVAEEREAKPAFTDEEAKRIASKHPESANTRRAHALENDLKAEANKAAKAKCDDIKKHIDPARVLRVAEKYGAEPDSLEFLFGSPVRIRIKGKAQTYNAIDLLYKHLNVPVSEAIEALEKEYDEQYAKPKPVVTPPTPKPTTNTEETPEQSFEEKIDAAIDATPTNPAPTEYTTPTPEPKSDKPKRKAKRNSRGTIIGWEEIK